VAEFSHLSIRSLHDAENDGNIRYNPFQDNGQKVNKICSLRVFVLTKLIFSTPTKLVRSIQIIYESKYTSCINKAIIPLFSLSFANTLSFSV
jgi:hypothetical protein